MIRWKRSWPDLNENLPLDVLPCSNGEYFPGEPTRHQRAIMRQARADCEAAARKLGLSRRHFLRTSAATAICLMAIDKVLGTEAYALGAQLPALYQASCGDDSVQLNNPAGEFVMDLQTHHVDSGGMWRATNPAFEAFFAAVWPQAGCGEPDRIECLSRYHYMKELFLDSATDVCVLSAVPSPPDQQLLPTDVAANTVQIVNQLAKSQRCVMHAFVMPNRGSIASSYSPNLICTPGGSFRQDSGVMPAFMGQEFASMEAAAAQYIGILKAWKVYTPWGDAPNSSGWWLDDPVGIAFLQEVQKIGNASGGLIPKMVCAHKGFALPGFDQRTAATRDVGVVASDPRFQDITFIIYHSGYDNTFGNPIGQGQTKGRYPENNENSISSCNRGVLNFIKALRENSWDATKFVAAGKTFGNVPNVYAELGSVWRDFVSDPTNATYILCNLIKYVGPKRVVWGTDSLWYGSPQSLIASFRGFKMDQAIADSYGLAYGLDGDVEDPTQPAPTPSRSIRNAILGRNAAVPYGIDPDATLGALKCDDVSKIRQQYTINPLAANEVYGPRTRRELFSMLREDRWWRGEGRYYKGKKIG